MKVIFVLYFININQLYKLNKTEKLLNVYGFNFFLVGRNESCLKNCCVFQNSTNNTSNIYNILKYKLPKNFLKLEYYLIQLIGLELEFTRETILKFIMIKFKIFF